MTADLITVDWKNRKKINSISLAPKLAPAPALDTKRNKRLVNDLKAMLDDLVDQVDLQDMIILVPTLTQDMATRADNREMNGFDLENIGRMYFKLRKSHAQQQ